MQSLNSVVTSGKVLYLGISNTPAWVVSKANQYARDHGFRQFSVYQGKWSAACRDLERDIIPMCISEGMGLAPWGVLGSGAFKSEEQRNSREGRKIDEVPESAIEASKVLERIAQKKHTVITSIALAYVMHKTPYVFPIVGGRKIEHLEGNIAALSLELSQEEIEEIEGAVPFDIGYPMNFLGRNEHESPLNKIGGHCEYVGHLKVCALKGSEENIFDMVFLAYSSSQNVIEHMLKMLAHDRLVSHKVMKVCFSHLDRRNAKLFPKR